MARWLSLMLVCSGCSPLIYLAAGGGPDDVLSLPIGSPVRGTTTGAHDDYDPRCAGDQEATDMAYAFEAPESGRYRVRVRGTYDVVVAVYDAERLLACNDDHDEATTAQILVELERGREYTVVVDGWAGAHGQYVVVAEHHPRSAEPVAPPRPTGEDPPVEDHAALAARCREAPALFAGETQGVLIPTDAHAVVSCGAGGRGPEAIYRLVVESPADLVVALTSELDAVVELRRGCAQDPQVIACVDDAPDARHTGLSAALEPGTYFLFVDSYAPDAGGPFHLEVELTPREAAHDQQQDQTP